jgi:LPXTG-motif cell wall-anchored protein
VFVRYTVTASAVAAPEPSSFALVAAMGLLGGGAAILRRRRKRSRGNR